jgi:AAA domain-containing protein
MAITFRKATKAQSRLRMALTGPSGSGKTYSALAIGQHLGSKLAVIDTERGSASKYADEFQFDVLELENFAPNNYVEAIHAAEEAGYDVLIIDSLSHAWMGKGGALEQVDKAAAKSQSKNSYFAWRDVTPQHNALVDAMLRSKCHVIATMRAKTEYLIENVNGKQTPTKVGLAAIQRDGIEYEFDVAADINLQHQFIPSKTRCKALDGAVIDLPGKQVADILNAWLTDGAPMPEPDPRIAELKGKLIAALVTLGKTDEEAKSIFAKNYAGLTADELASWLEKAQAKIKSQSKETEAV